MSSPKIKYPCARHDGLIVQELPGETLVYDLERDRAHCLNETAAFVWRHCDGKSSASVITRALKTKFKQPVEEQIVWLAIDQLARKRLLKESPALPPKLAGMNRREAVRALGITAAVALPVVASIVAPFPAQAATCLGQGDSCTSTFQCCSGLICNNSICQ